MSTLQFLGIRDGRPTRAGGRGDEVWGDLELPGWDDFTGARDRFFASLNRAHELRLAPNEAEGPDADAAGENPR